MAGEWVKGFKKPLWVITNLEPEEALRIYRARMKIDESFKDLKSLLNLKKVMNKQVVALVLLAYAIGLPVPAFWVLVGEALWDRMYGNGGDGPRSRSPSGPEGKRGKRWQLYSGLFVLLKQKLRLGREDRDGGGARVLQKAGLG